MNNPHFPVVDFDAVAKHGYQRLVTNLIGFCFFPPLCRKHLKRYLAFSKGISGINVPLKNFPITRYVDFMALRHQPRAVWAMLCFVVLLMGCASPQVNDYARQTPSLVLHDYFRGNLTAHGIFTDRQGKVIKRFHREIAGHLDRRKWPGSGCARRAIFLQRRHDQFANLAAYPLGWRPLPRNRGRCGRRGSSVNRQEMLFIGGIPCVCPWMDEYGRSILKIGCIWSMIKYCSTKPP
jgi:hypothetical protein